MIITLIAFLSSSAFAGTEFTGTWAGEGSATNQVGFVFPGCQIEIEINQSDNRFSIGQGSYQCGDLSGRINPVNAEIIGGELFYGNEKIGNLESGHVSFKHETQDFDTYYDLTIDNGAIIFQKTQFNAALPENYINVTGLLIHQ